ncbi:MAG: nucleotidyltransferase family protein [Candidatus Lokiarchaeota archaeon]|nr:nucleotidyltransferase family protein [Candidatus Lokiarchaeota archaeon]
MTNNLRFTEAIRDKIITILKKHGAKKISIFGSYVRGEATPESDLDIIVEFEQPMGLIKFVGIEFELSDSLGIKVDLLTEKSISPYLIDIIRKEATVIYK